MKTICFIFLVTLGFAAKAGTPSIGDTTLLYGIILILILSLIGIPYLIKLIKNKFINSHKMASDNLNLTEDQDSSNP